jgi:hypothetical protein
MPNINKEHAESIAKKLAAECVDGAKHTLVKIHHNGRLVAQFGIQRGSKKDALHSYIPGQIFVSKKECLGLAVCTLSRDEWVAILQDKGHIERDANQ